LFCPHPPQLAFPAVFEETTGRAGGRKDVVGLTALANPQCGQVRIEDEGIVASSSTIKSRKC
jgi:hypothetical protein